MKKSFFGSCLIILCISLQGITLKAQENAIPETVQTTFNKLFPSATEVDWEQDGEEYLAGFENADFSFVEVTIFEDGTWQQTVTSLSAEELPTAAQTTINDEFTVETYYNISKVETAKETLYLVSFETTTQSVSLRFDTDGNLIDKEVEDL